MTNSMELDYTNRDYESILNFLVSAARGFMPEWVTVGESADMGTMLLEMYAYVGDVVNFYIDRVAAEPFLATAQRRQSVLGVADMLGYTPIAQSPAGGTVKFTITDTNAYLTDNSLLIPSASIVQTMVDQITPAVYYETIGVLYLGGTVREGSIGIQEGRTIASEFLALSDGAPLQEYVLTYRGVIHRSLRMFIQETDIDTIEWSYVDHLSDSNPDASVYTTYLDDQEFLHVVFGDNVAGRIPPTGAQIEVSYRYGMGATGNVASAKITVMNKPIPGVTVINTVPTSGGANNESIEAMRHSIPRSTRILNRAITLNDFAALAMQVPGVKEAAAIGEFYTQVKVYIAPVGGGYPTQQLLDAVGNYLAERSLVGTTVEMHPLLQSDGSPGIPPIDPIYTTVIVGMMVHVLPQYGQLTVKNAVTAAITNVFSFDSNSFGEFISRGEVYHAALNVTGVDWIELDTLRPLDDAGDPVGAQVQDIQVGATRIPISVADNITVNAEGGLV